LAKSLVVTKDWTKPFALSTVGKARGNVNCPSAATLSAHFRNHLRHTSELRMLDSNFFALASSTLSNRLTSSAGYWLIFGSCVLPTNACMVRCKLRSDFIVAL
jgi:hypothetical protein